MKKSRFTESQVVAVLKEGEAGVPVAQVARKHGISVATYYHWKAKYAGTGVPELMRLRELEAENARLKRMVAQRQEVALDVLDPGLDDALLLRIMRRAGVDLEAIAFGTQSRDT